MRELLGGLRTTRSLVRLPLMPPSVTLLTGVGESDADILSGKLQRPYGELIRAGQRLVGPPQDGPSSVLNVSISAGFFLTDSPKAGMTVVVTTRGDQQAADRHARALAQQAWDWRERFAPKLVPIEEAVGRLLGACNDPAAPALCLADVADNPGGGGRGNTTDLLKALLDAGAHDIALAAFNDAALAAQAHELGVGARFGAEINRDEAHPLSGRLTVNAQVMALSDGRVVGRRGSAQGRQLTLGPSARIRLFGPPGAGARAAIDLIVISNRQQCTDPAIPEHLGVDLGRLRGFVVKSRGHFRAGFSEFFDDARILDVDAPGLSTPVLSRLPYRNLPHPIFPIDPATQWQAPEA
jgi:microcystin degradation protein MlrC